MTARRRAIVAGSVLAASSWSAAACTTEVSQNRWLYDAGASNSVAPHAADCHLANATGLPMSTPPANHWGRSEETRDSVLDIEARKATGANITALLTPNPPAQTGNDA